MNIFYALIAFVIITFPLAFFWHMRIFREKYEKWQYFAGDAQPALGMLAMIIQGSMLALAYSKYGGGQGLNAALIFAAIMGIIFWSIHVIATMAKQGSTRNAAFLIYETIYMILQFGLYGVVLGLIFA